MKIIVIGGGAAGMMAAIAAAESGSEVILIEKNEKLGKKIFITGKGRCNVTNACDKQDFFDHIVTNPRFMYSSFGKWNNWDMYSFLEEAGVPLKIERGNRVFPESDKSSDIIRALENELRRQKVRVRPFTRVKELLLEEEECRGVVVQKLEPRMNSKTVLGEEKITADRVIVCTGGLSYPSTGSTGDGYIWAEKAGLKVTETSPALVPLTAEFPGGRSCREVQGLALKNVAVSLCQKDKKLTGDFGEMLFTHFGVSGPVLLSASSRVTEALKQGPLTLEINLKPALTPEQLDSRLVRECEGGRNRQLSTLLTGWMPKALIPEVLRQASIREDRIIHDLTKEERVRFLYALQHLMLTVTGLRGYNEAIITQGGIDVKEIAPGTMESKKIRHLYFAGEILDVDAYTGGYNLQVAWSTGYTAGKAAALE